VVYYWATRNMDEEALHKFESWLWMPPKGVVAEQGPWSAEAETQAFAAFTAEATGQREVKTI
jgi:hypothetical protein